MTLTFHLNLLENPKFRELITNKEMLNTYRSLPDAKIEHINFFIDRITGDTCSMVIYSYDSFALCSKAKDSIIFNPTKDSYKVEQERNLLTIYYHEHELDKATIR